MIHESCELLSMSGWRGVGKGKFATVAVKDEKISVEWKSLDVEPKEGKFIEFDDRFFSMCVGENYAIPAISYGSGIHGNDKGVRVPASVVKEGDWIAINNFTAKKPKACNPFIPFLNSYTKKTPLSPTVGVKKNDTWHLEDTAQFRLIKDLVTNNRFKDVAKWHGRENVIGLNGDKMHGVIEFSNYSPRTIDQIELSALADNRKIERLSPSRLRVFPDRYRLRISKKRTFESSGFKILGNYDFLLTRYNGKIAIV